jgi:hypothetical protein
MLINTLIAVCLVFGTVVIHAVGFSALLRALMRSHALDRSGFWVVTRSMIGLTLWLVLIHLAEIVLWGQFYFWWGCMPDAESGFYFSAVTYTTVGYGDVMLPLQWRNLAPVEALTAILMCGLSTGIFFAVVLRWIANFMRSKTATEPPSAADQ